MEDEAQWIRLREEQEKAIVETDAKVKQLNSYMDDYKALKTRLDTLPHKVTHDVMVPFGDLAFMPGKIYNTNEVLVLLGDNWFTETSAHHAGEIVDRRIEDVHEQIKKLEEQKSLLQPRREFTEELQQMAKTKQDLVDIKEDYDAEKEQQWKDQRKKKSAKENNQDLQKQRELMQAKARKISQQLQQAPPKPQAPPPSETPPSQVTTTDDEHEEKMKRLDELLMQERRERQLTSSTVEEETLQIPTNYPKRSGKTIRWKDDEGEQDDWCTDDEDDNGDDSDDNDEDDDDDDEEEEEYKERLPSVIKVKFTKVAETEDTSGSTEIKSPRDIYKRFVEPNLSKPASILKRTSSVEEPRILNQGTVGEVLERISTNDIEGQGDTGYNVAPPSAPPVAAFGDTVREKITTNQMVATLCASLDDIEVTGRKKSSAAKPSTGPTAGKRVSKFKQRQMQGKS